MEYQFDGDRLIGHVVTREPEFTPEDLALLLAFQRAENAPRGPHGHLLSEAMDPAANPSVEGGFHYEAALPTTDWAEKALKDAQDAYYKKYKDANRNGHSWAVRRVED